jgi:hypothetical protein
MDSEELYLIILKKGSNIKILTQDNFTSEDGTLRLYSKGEKAFVDLGLKNKYKKYAELLSDQIRIHIDPSPIIPMKTSSCDSLFEYSSEECISQRKYGRNCSDISDVSFSLALLGSITALSNHPGFKETLLLGICVQLTPLSELIL